MDCSFTSGHHWSHPGTQFINWHCRHHRICITIISNQIHPLLRIPSSVLVKRSLNKNEVQKVYEESMADESQPARALYSTKSFLLERQKKKRLAERNTLANVDWNVELKVSSLLQAWNVPEEVPFTSQWKENKLALVLRYVWVAQYPLETENNDTISDSVLQCWRRCANRLFRNDTLCRT